MKIFLVRHAESTANAAGELATLIPGPHLTEVGLEQAANLVHAFEGIPLEAIYASSMIRTSETAAPLSASRAIPVVVLDGIHEIQAGELEGARDRDSMTRYRNVIAEWAQGRFEVPIPGSFDGNHFLARFDEAIDALMAKHDPDATVVVVTHSVAMRVWVASRSDNAGPAFTSSAPLDNVGIVELRSNDSGSFTVTRWQDIDPSA